MTAKSLDIPADAGADLVDEFIVFVEIRAVEAGRGPPADAEARVDLAAVELQRRCVDHGE
jgi:hypothetical protein